jgi:tRNA(fMet)-specific endonuclease VapC
VILLDTDHLTMLKYPENPRYAALTQRLEASPDQEIGTTIISIEEQWRGWLAVISRVREVNRQVRAYQELVGLLDFLGRWTVLPFDDAAAAEFGRLRGAKVRVPTMDLKIASFALVQGALLLSANLRDFQQVPGLRVDNWLE